MKRHISLFIVTLCILSLSHELRASDRVRRHRVRTGISLSTTGGTVIPMVPAYTRPGARPVFVSPTSPPIIGIIPEPRHRTTCDCAECTATPRPPHYKCDDGVKRAPREVYVDNHNWCLQIYDPSSGWYTDRNKHIQSTVTLFWSNKDKGWCFYHNGLLHWYDSRDSVLPSN